MECSLFNNLTLHSFCLTVLWCLGAPQLTPSADNLESAWLSPGSSSAILLLKEEGLGRGARKADGDGLNKVWVNSASDRD